MSADTNPLLSAVKKDDPKIGTPENKKENEKMINPCSVMFINGASYPTNNSDNGRANSSEAANIAADVMPTITKLLRKMLFNSALFPAP